jgi:hypothetical protein
MIDYETRDTIRDAKLSDGRADTAGIEPADPASFAAWREGWQRNVLKSRLPPGAKLVAVFICFHLNRKSLQAWPSVETIAAGTGQTTRNVHRAIKHLWEAQCLSITRKSGRSNHYMLLHG